MSKATILIVAALAAFALSATAASSASAASWHVNGTELAEGSSVEIPFQLPWIHLTIILHFTAGGTPFLILCGSVHLFGRLWGHSRFWLRLLYLRCHTISPTPTNCNLTGGQTGELTAIEIPSVLGEAKSSTRSSIKPETGKVLSEIPFKEGTACALEGQTPVKGEAIFGTPTGGEEKIEQASSGLGSQENNSLEVGSGNKAFFLWYWLYHLAGSATWSFR
jgi:hypothetical protein